MFLVHSQGGDRFGMSVDRELDELISAISLGYKYNQGDMDFVDEWRSTRSPVSTEQTLLRLKQYLVEHEHPEDYLPIKADYSHQMDPRAIVVEKLSKHGIRLSPAEIKALWHKVDDKKSLAFRAALIREASKHSEFDQGDAAWLIDELCSIAARYENRSVDDHLSLLAVWIERALLGVNIEVAYLVAPFANRIDESRARHGFHRNEVGTAGNFAMCGTLFEVLLGNEDIALEQIERVLSVFEAQEHQRAPICAIQSILQRTRKRTPAHIALLNWTERVAE